ncbi:mechanosensitive ion channel [Candidatus Roizmanbacteria bacterium]|nr:mechanosensitive ion channel [Candidatus Roizmanbacteria bacterium]
MNFLSSNHYIDNTVFTLFALIFTLFLSYSIKRTIDFIFLNVKTRITHESLLARTRTIRGILKNIVDVVLFLIVGLVCLSQWGINISPILTGAGILGLAVSFGSQTLVKDLIAGFFIIFEDQFSVGDRVKIGTSEGKVYKITLRLTILEDKAGNLIYIPNSQITTVVREKSSKKSNIIRVHA